MEGGGGGGRAGGARAREEGVWSCVKRASRALGEKRDGADVDAQQKTE
jgi:hypothetical protein